MLGAGEPVRVKAGERVLFHVVNGSATEIRSLALPGHTVSRDRARRQSRARLRSRSPALWIGTGERVSAVVEMNQPGVWVLGDLSDDDRKNGMGIVVEYAGQTGKPGWRTAGSPKWNYSWFGRKGAPATEPDETIDLLFAKDNAADEGIQSLDDQRPSVRDGAARSRCSNFAAAAATGSTCGTRATTSIRCTCTATPSR